MGASTKKMLMFIRKKRNNSGSITVQILQKTGRKNKILKTIGTAKSKSDENKLLLLAKNEMERLKGLQYLFVEPEDVIVDSFINTLSNSQFQIIGTQLILGKIFDKIGYNSLKIDQLFKNLVLCRLVYPGSKLKTVRYLKNHFNQDISVYSIYRFLDRLHSKFKDKIQEITFLHTKKILKGKITVAFYDMTTLFFEASEEDELRKIGMSKDGKFQQPQIMIGLLVGKNGYPIGYEIFKGNTSETKTLIPVLKQFETKFNIVKPIIVADCALLSEKNLENLEKEGYKYILGGRIKNETAEIKQQVLSLKIKEGYSREIQTAKGRLIITYSSKRARKDAHNRIKGLQRLEKRVISGKLTKKHINNRGYNKYLKIEGKATIGIDYEKYNQDVAWDGLKGYVTNTLLSKSLVIKQYHHLWHIEKAFRISKTDLRIRPIYHRLERRIEAHICICFTAYAVIKEFERLLEKNKIKISVQKAISELKEIRQLTYILPKSKQIKSTILKMNTIQSELMKIKI